MLPITIQVLKVEGIENGNTCKVMLNDEELAVKNNIFTLEKEGILSIEFFKSKHSLGGVIFSSHLLYGAICQYLPLYIPSIYIDNLPDDIDPPRVLFIQIEQNSDYASQNSRCETILFEDFNTVIEVNNFKNLMTNKNKDYVIKDLQFQREKISSCVGSKGPDDSSAYDLLLSKINNDAFTISKLNTERNEFLVRIRELEQENIALKNENKKQELALKRMSIKENFVRKELETKKLFEKLTEGRITDQLRDKNIMLKSKLEAYQYETMNFKEKYENTEKSYKVLKECLLGNDINQ
ncbi:hypothetical protein SteCoe_36959 [Stentor coeruleus]|uniref:Uncharacterized protein n=1 Tax=Stentor coeruleus TaxID=5963 RepID=A0A1R2AP20_9CILI|nr:hypothetical protein SteCoe_36959 [Stentor coeruleus]